MKSILNKIVKNKKLLALTIVIAVILVIAGLYGTFASNSTVAGTNDTYTITLTDSSNTINIPANSSKTVIYKLTNTNKGVVKYGIGYSGTNIVAKIYSDSPNSETGLFDYGDTKFIKLYITNSGSSNSTATITSVLGYENGGNLIVPSGVTLVTEVYNVEQNATFVISKLFSKTGTVTSNSISHDIDATHQLIKDQAGNIRYYGTGITDTGGTYKEPDNYIDIGDRDSSNNPILWRIIGVFDGKLKLIRSTYITADNDTGLSWDTSTVNSGYGINQWGGSGSYEGSDLMKLLNPEYENNQDLNSSGSTITVNNSLWYNSQSGTCYNGRSNATTSCNFTSTGLSENVKNKIAEVTWNTGGWDNSLVYPNLIYEKERGTTVYTGTADGITRTTSWTGKIGLAYPSDYGYATDLQECNQTLNNYSNAGTNNTYPCRGNNWMWYAMTGATTATSTSRTKTAWLLTPGSSKAYFAWIADRLGFVIDYYVFTAYAVSPVLYLKSDVLIDGGDGTSSNPYIAKDPPTAASTISNLFNSNDTVTSNGVPHQVDTAHQLIKDEAGNIRYYGTGITDTGGTYKEPNNYINIGDNVLWRIIGVFDGKLKLIRSTYITADNSVGLSWDTSANTSTTNDGKGINEWSQADLMKLLNPGYDSNQDLNSSGATITVNNSLWYNSQSGTCYTGQSNATTSCNFISTGLSNSEKNKIADVTWNTGGWNSSLGYPNLIYDKERGTTVISSPSDGITRTTSWTGKIGLAYPSDYGYATDLSQCNQTLGYYDSSTNNYACRGNNWMWYAMTGATTASSNGPNNAWLLTPNSSSSFASHAWAVTDSGGVTDFGGTYAAVAVSPVMYLKSEQVIESGRGTSSEPYVLSA